jgi:hypothetical protein
MRLLFSALLLVGCQTQHAPIDEPTLDELPGLTLEVSTVARPDASTLILVEASYDWQAYLGDHSECAILSSDTVAMFDQTPVPLTSGGMDDEGDCLAPMFETELVLATTGAHHVTLPDNIAMDFADGQVVARSATPASGEWTLIAGQSFTVTWSMPSDLAAQTPAGIDAAFLPTNANVAVLLTGTAIGTDTFTVAVPAEPLGTGDGVIDLELGTARGNATTCSGATQCTWSADAAYWHTATL